MMEEQENVKVVQEKKESLYGMQVFWAIEIILVAWALAAGFIQGFPLSSLTPGMGFVLFAALSVINVYAAGLIER